jgi:hypothetical protein
MLPWSDYLIQSNQAEDNFEHLEMYLMAKANDLEKYGCYVVTVRWAFL